MRKSHPLRYIFSVMVVAGSLLGVMSGEALAQLGGFDRITTPNGRAVLEIRKGTHLASPDLLFTAVVTAGPSSGTTSLLLQQALVQDVFNSALPAAPWTVVRSSFTGFSLGGGCGRSNLIDFPFINANRPEILRITGTNNQVITLTIANTDQYDSIDCIVQGDGQVLYMLTNRTQKKLEFRREVSGTLALVRDDFGVVITPFVGGVRPSITRIRAAAALATFGRTDPFGESFAAFGIFFLKEFVPDQVIVEVRGVDDDPFLTPLGTCQGPISTLPPGFTIPKDSTIADAIAVGNSRDDNVLWGDHFYVDNGTCTVLQPPESFGPAGPFTLYTWAAVAARSAAQGPPGQGGARVGHTTLVVPNNVIVFEGSQRQNIGSPFANRGGPLTTCPLNGSEIDAAQLAIGVGPVNTQVQHSIIDINLLETIFGSSFESVWGSLSRCE
jgi:hypothetical protein